MKKNFYFSTLTAFSTMLILLSSCKRHDEFPPLCGGDDSTVTTSRIYATGLNNPRGLKFGPDGYLYVAEGGVGGKNISTNCVQAPPPVGPYMGSFYGSRISRINRQGLRTTFVDSLPSSTAGAATGSGVTGMADVAFIGNSFYALIAGAGCSHGVPERPNGIIKINPDASWSIIANYSDFLISHPTKNSDPEDFTQDGNPFSMVTMGGNFYIVEPNHGELDKVMPNGNISRVIDISASQGHIVPTAVTYHNGYFYVGNLGVFPITGISNIYKISPSGQIKTFASGFSTILSVAFDSHDRLYVLENTVGAPGPTPGLGDVVRVDPSGKRQVIISGLNLPTAMTFGQDGRLYISNWGIGAPGSGQILQISFKCEDVMGDNNMLQK